MKSSKISIVWNYFKDIEDFNDLEVFDHILSIMIEEFQKSPKIHLNNFKPEIRFNEKTFAEINVKDNIYHIKFLELMNYYNSILLEFPNNANILFYNKNNNGKKVPVEINCEDLGGKIVNGQITILLDSKTKKNKKENKILPIENGKYNNEKGNKKGNKKEDEQNEPNGKKNYDQNDEKDDETDYNLEEVNNEIGKEIENELDMEEEIEMTNNVISDNYKQLLFETMKNEDKSKLNIEKLQEYLLLIENEIDLNNVNRNSLINQINEAHIAYQQKYIFLDTQIKYLSSNTLYLDDQKTQIEMLLNVKNENEKLKRENEELRKSNEKK